MPNIFCLGSGVFGSTLYTWDIYNITTSTSYTALKRVVVNDNDNYIVMAASSTTDVFGSTSFYAGTSVVNGVIQNATQITATTMQSLWQATSGVAQYIQLPDDYTGETRENIFTVSLSSAWGSGYLVLNAYQSQGLGNVPVLDSAVDGTRVSVADATTGWNTTDYCYYSDIESTTTQAQGTSTGNTVTSYNATQYPVNGVSGGYWYVRRSA